MVKAVARAEAPIAPILLFKRFRDMRMVLVVKAVARAVAHTAPILLPPRCRVVRNKSLAPTRAMCSSTLFIFCSGQRRN